MSEASLETPGGDELEPDEPRTPLWLPVLGLALFLAALGYTLATSDETGDAPAAENPGAESPGTGAAEDTAE